MSFNIIISIAMNYNLENKPHKLSISNNCYKCGDDSYFYNIYDNERNSIIIQTPFLWCPHKPEIITKQNSKRIFNICLSFYNLLHDEHSQKLYNFVTSSETNFSRWLNIKHETEFQWFASLHGKQSKCQWELKSTEVNSICCFDSGKNKIPIERIKPRQYVRAVIHVSKLWFKPKTLMAGIEYNIIQLQTNNSPYLETYSFYDKEPSSSTNTCQKCSCTHNTQETVSTSPPVISKNIEDSVSKHPLYEKYFKMLSMGIPKQAIKQKMILNNLPPEVIDVDPNDPLPEQYRPSSDEDDDVVQEDNLFSSIANGIELKHCEISTLDENVPAKRKNQFTVSLEDITERLQSLRPVAKPTVTTVATQNTNTILSILSKKFGFF